MRNVVGGRDISTVLAGLGQCIFYRGIGVSKLLPDVSHQVSGGLHWFRTGGLSAIEVG